jgi:exopolysaccharide production protein ExoZ
VAQRGLAGAVLNYDELLSRFRQETRVTQTSRQQAGAEQGQRRLDGLDTLRGVAILMVIGFHASLHFPLGTLTKSVLAWGNQGVQLFFLISAFTMCLMWDARAHESERTKNFYIRRFMRIAPLYWLALVFYFVWADLRGDETSTAYQVLLNLLFLHVLSPTAINSTVPGGWSIAVEMSFYLVFPLLAAVIKTRPLHAMGLALLAYVVLGLAASAWVRQSFNAPALFIYYSQLTQFPVFPIGMALYAVITRKDLNPQQLRLGLALTCAWLVFAFAGKYLWGIESRPFFWLQVFIFAGLIYAVLRRGWSLPLLAKIGTLSYSMYLFHFAVLKVAEPWVPEAWRTSLLGYLAYTVIVVAVSMWVGMASAASFERWSAIGAKRLVAGLARRRGAIAAG